jgi:hypothetical protein
MDKNSESLWLMIGQMPPQSGGYSTTCEIKLSGMADIKGFLEAFLPAEIEGEKARIEFDKLGRVERKAILESILGYKYTPFFFVRDYRADFSCGEETNVSIQEFLEGDYR